MAYTVYTNDEQGVLRVQELLSEQNVGFEVLQLASVQFSHEEIVHLLDLLGMWAVDLVDKNDTAWKDSHLNSESDDGEVVDFIVHNPTSIKTPIVLKDNSKAMYCDPPEQVLRLFS